MIRMVQNLNDLCTVRQEMNYLRQKKSVEVNVQYFTPVYTSLIAGLDTVSGVDPHTEFEDRHLFCDWLLCSIVYALHISYVTIYYGTCTMIQSKFLSDLKSF